ncbi:hypothetical protein PTTG_28232 [Puccinia triticina 1-1 BBBD Race 1]|uniref:SMP domain-containing protein n=1 Tax=Puccinia triticina (isolate 1-1 / race 1 (BBBD)) TaxID=630390 RepID=A0A180GDR8_PUCT1|nr:hypothetical protein PTTG_28232 [Puccinia triticina 1-1 BBBD Race 1]
MVDEMVKWATQRLAKHTPATEGTDVTASKNTAETSEMISDTQVGNVNTGSKEHDIGAVLDAKIPDPAGAVTVDKPTNRPAESIARPESTTARYKALLGNIPQFERTGDDVVVTKGMAQVAVTKPMAPATESESINPAITLNEASALH